VVLFEVSIGVSALVQRRKRRRREAASAENPE